MNYSGNTSAKTCDHGVKPASHRIVSPSCVSASLNVLSLSCTSRSMTEKMESGGHEQSGTAMMTGSMTEKMESGKLEQSGQQSGMANDGQHNRA